MSQRLVAVVGATGKQGGSVINYLVDRENDIKIRALTRNVESTKSKSLAARGCEVVATDMSNRESVEAAFQNCWGVYIMTMNPSPTGDEAADGIRMVDAAIAANVSYVVYTSVGSAHLNTNIPHFETKRRVEEHLLANKEKFCDGYAILRPVAFMDNLFMFEPSNGVVMNLTEPNTKLQMISTKDIGIFGGKALEDPAEWNGKEMDLAGDNVDGLEMAQVFSKIGDCEMQYTSLPWYYWIAIRLMEGGDLATMTAWFESTGYSADIDACREIHPELQSFEDFAREHFSGKEFGPSGGCVFL